MIHSKKPTQVQTIISIATHDKYQLSIRGSFFLPFGSVYGARWTPI